MVTAHPTVAVARSSLLRWFSVGLLLLGATLSVLMPFASATLFSITLGAVAITAGIAQLLRIPQATDNRGRIFRGLSAALYLLGGLTLLLYPVQGVISLTLYIGFLLLFEGVMELAVAAADSLPARGLVLLDGIVTALLGVLLIVEWPSDSFWVIGTLLGISLAFSAVNLLSGPFSPENG